MNEIVLRMIETQALLFLYALAGFALSKAKIITQSNRGGFVRMLMDLCIPCMVLSAFNRAYTNEELLSSATVLAASGIMCAGFYAVGRLLWRKKETRRRNVLQYGTVFSNMGTAGLPVVSLVFGEVGLFYASMYLIVPRILQWTYGIGLFSPKCRGFKAFVHNVLLNPVVVVCYAGFAMIVFRFQIGGVVGSAVKNIGNMTAPLSMMLIGATLGGVRLKEFFQRDAITVAALRLLVLPLATLLVLRLFPIDVLTVSICVTLAAMPVASNTAALAERYDGDYPFASVCVGLSTVLSVATVPMMTWVIQSVFA